jgi:hypothetical protein
MSSSEAERMASKTLFEQVNAGSILADLYQSPIVDMSAFMPDLSKMFPDYGKMAIEPLMTTLQNSIVPAMETAYPVNRLAEFHKLLIDSSGINSVSKMLVESHNLMLKDLIPSFNALNDWAKENQFQTTLLTMAKETAFALDNPAFSGLLATASTFRERLDEQELEGLTDEFFETHPDLAASIEQSPAVRTLSLADRRVIVWTVGLIVMLYVSNALLHLGTDCPELKAIVDALGLDAGGGLPAGYAAAKLTGKALEKLPEADEE